MGLSIAKMKAAWKNIHKWVIANCDNQKPDFALFERIMSYDDIQALTENERNSIVHFAALGESDTVLKYILRIAPKDLIDTQNRNGETPLHWTIYAGNLKNAKVLLAAGANTKKKDNQQNSLLHLAVESGSKRTVKFVLRNSLCNNINAQNNTGVTPLDLAKLQKHKKIVQLLQAH